MRPRAAPPVPCAGRGPAGRGARSRRRRIGGSSSSAALRPSRDLRPFEPLHRHVATGGEVGFHDLHQIRRRRAPRKVVHPFGAVHDRPTAHHPPEPIFGLHPCGAERTQSSGNRDRHPIRRRSRQRTPTRRETGGSSTPHLPRKRQSSGNHWPTRWKSPDEAGARDDPRQLSFENSKLRARSTPPGTDDSRGSATLARRCSQPGLSSSGRTNSNLWHQVGAVIEKVMLVDSHPSPVASRSECPPGYEAMAAVQLAHERSV